MSKDETWIRLEKGIRCKKHPTRKHGVKPDTYFVLRFAVDGKMYQEALGWASEGITLAKARVELARLKEAKRLGEGPRSLRERRDIAEAERKAKEDDCRLKSIVLTPKALEIKKAVKKQIDIEEKNIVNHMTKEEQKQFLELLKKTSSNLENGKKKEH